MILRFQPKDWIHLLPFRRLFISLLVVSISCVTGMGNEVNPTASDVKPDIKQSNIISFNSIESTQSLSEIRLETIRDDSPNTYQVDTLSDGDDRVASVSGSSDAPANFKLKQNYPNPFNPATEITYQLPVSEQVILKVYDMLGRPVKTLINKNQSAGSYTVRFNAEDLTSGMYLYRLKAGSYEQIRKMILIK